MSWKRKNPICDFGENASKVTSSLTDMFSKKIGKTNDISLHFRRKSFTFFFQFSNLIKFNKAQKQILLYVGEYKKRKYRGNILHTKIRRGNIYEEK